MKTTASAKILEAKALLARSDERGDGLSEEEEKKISGLLAEADRLHAGAKLRDAIDSWERPMPRQVRDSGEPLPGGGGGPTLPAELRWRAPASGLNFRTADGQTVRALSAGERLFSGGLPVGIGDVIRSMLTGRADLAGPEFKAAIGGLDPSGGFLLSQPMSAEVIDLARSASVCLRAGAQTIPMETSELGLVRLAQDATATWRSEAVDVPASDLLFEKVTLRARTLATVIPISLELAEDSPNASAVITTALTNALALTLDQAALVGTGAASQPLGVRNSPSVNTVTSVSTPTDYSKYSSAVQKIYEANFAGEPSALAWIAHPRDLAKLDILEDSTGQPLNPTPWTGALRKFSTTSLPTTEGGGAESVAVIGDFSEMLFGMRTSGVVIRVLESGQVTDNAGKTWNAASQLLRLIVAHLRADIVLLRPKFFTVLSGITTT